MQTEKSFYEFIKSSVILYYSKGTLISPLVSEVLVINKIENERGICVVLFLD